MAWLGRTRLLFILVVTEWIFRLLDHLGLLLRHNLLAFGELSVKTCDTLHATRVFILGCPAAEEDGTLLLDLRIRQVCRAGETQAFEQGFVCEGTLESGTGILDEAIEEGQGAELAVQVAILELLPDGTGGFCWARVLEVDNLD